MSAPIPPRMCPLNYDPKQSMIDSIKDPNIPLSQQSKHVQAYELIYNENAIPLSDRYRIQVLCRNECLQISWVKSYMLGQWLEKNVKGFKIYESRSELELKHKMELEENNWVKKNIRSYEDKGVLDLGLIDSISLLFLLAIDYFSKKN